MAELLLNVQTAGARGGVAVRAAKPSDVPMIRTMQHESMRALGRDFYSDSQIESFLRFMPTMEECLVSDATFYVAESAGRIAGCGGWSLRTPAYHTMTRAHAFGVPLPKVRAMYVHPDFARRGVGRSLLAVIEGAIVRAGYSEAGLDALLPGAPLYRSCGYRAVANAHAEFPDGIRMQVLTMHKHFAVRWEEARRVTA